MEESTTKEKVLKKIRNALIYKTDNPYQNIDFKSPIYTPSADPNEVTFAEELTKVGGNFIFCENENELAEILKSFVIENKWTNIFCLDEEIQGILNYAQISYQFEDKDFHDLKVAFTRCEFLIARLGSIMISSKQTSGRRLNIYPDVHVVIAYTSQIVPDLRQALDKIKEKYSNSLPSLVSVITGPSRTADIEKTLVMGAHGPKELYVFLVDDTEIG